MKTFVKILLVSFLCWGLSYNLSAQTSPNTIQQIKLLKVGYFSQKIDLTPEEAPQFWVYYNELQNKKDAIKKDSTFSEIQAAEKKLTLQKEYDLLFKETIGEEKTKKLYEAEKTFLIDIIAYIKNKMEEDTVVKEE